MHRLRTLTRAALPALVLGWAAVAVLAVSAQTPEQRAALSANLFRPQQLPFEETLVERLSLPAGFRIGVFASGMGSPRLMAVAPDGTVYITRRGSDDVVAIRDSDGDGKADTSRVVVPKLTNVHGIVLRGETLYLGTPTEVYTAALKADGTAEEPRLLIGGLPDPGQHPAHGLLFGPDGFLYMNLGANCNVCSRSAPEIATLLRIAADGSSYTVHAQGLRNTIGFGWHPTTGELWGMDHGSDWRGDDQPPEELNKIEPGRDYGWPYCYGDREVDLYFSQEPEGSTKQAFCARTAGPALVYQAHSAPIAMLFYTGGQFPAAYQGDAFVAMRGSWNRYPATGYSVVRVRYQDGRPVGFEEFLTGFLTNGGEAHFGRLAGLAQLPDGSLLVGDDTNGVIYRVSYAGN